MEAGLTEIGAGVAHGFWKVGWGSVAVLRDAGGVGCLGPIGRLNAAVEVEGLLEAGAVSCGGESRRLVARDVPRCVEMKTPALWGLGFIGWARGRQMCPIN